MGVQMSCRRPCQGEELLATALFSPKVLELKFQSTAKFPSEVKDFFRSKPPECFRTSAVEDRALDQGNMSSRLCAPIRLRHIVGAQALLRMAMVCGGSQRI